MRLLELGGSGWEQETSTLDKVPTLPRPHTNPKTLDNTLLYYNVLKSSPETRYYVAKPLL